MNNYLATIIVTTQAIRQVHIQADDADQAMEKAQALKPSEIDKGQLTSMVRDNVVESTVEDEFTDVHVHLEETSVKHVENAETYPAWNCTYKRSDVDVDFCANSHDYWSASQSQFFDNIIEVNDAYDIWLKDGRVVKLVRSPQELLEGIEKKFGVKVGNVPRYERSKTEQKVKKQVESWKKKSS